MPSIWLSFNTHFFLCGVISIWTKITSLSGCILIHIYLWYKYTDLFCFLISFGERITTERNPSSKWKECYACYCMKQIQMNLVKSLLFSSYFIPHNSNKPWQCPKHLWEKYLVVSSYFPRLKLFLYSLSSTFPFVTRERLFTLFQVISIL